MFSQLKGKTIVSSIDRSTLPKNLSQKYSCQLICEQYLKNDIIIPEIYLKFQSQDRNEPNFQINLFLFKEPNNLQYTYQMGKNINQIKLKNKVQLQCTAKLTKDIPFQQNIVAIEQSEDQYVQDVVFDRKRLNFNDNSDNDESFSQSSQQDFILDSEQKNKIRIILIQIMNIQQNKKKSIKDISNLLKQRIQLKISLEIIKEILNEICIKIQRKYMLKNIYIYQNIDEKIQNSEPKKKIKFN